MDSNSPNRASRASFFSSLIDLDASHCAVGGGWLNIAHISTPAEEGNVKCGACWVVNEGCGN